MIKVEVNTKGNVVIETTKNYSLSDFTLLLLNAILYMAKNAIAKAPKGEEEKYKATIYDMLNLRFSGLLENLAPEYELNPGLTEEAIMKAENEILEEKVKQYEMSKVQK